MNYTDSAGGRRRVRTERVTFAVTPDEKNWLLDRSRRSGQTMAAFLREDVLQYYELELLMQQAKEASERAEARYREYAERAQRARTDRRHGRSGFGGAGEAESWLRTYTGAQRGDSLKTVLRRAYHLAHPDKGGHKEDWDKVDRARRLLT